MHRRSMIFQYLCLRNEPVHGGGGHGRCQALFFSGCEDHHPVQSDASCLYQMPLRRFLLNPDVAFRSLEARLLTEPPIRLPRLEFLDLFLKSALSSFFAESHRGDENRKGTPRPKLQIWL